MLRSVSSLFWPTPMDQLTRLDIDPRTVPDLFQPIITSNTIYTSSNLIQAAFKTYISLQSQLRDIPDNDEQSQIELIEQISRLIAITTLKNLKEAKDRCVGIDSLLVAKHIQLNGQFTHEIETLLKIWEENPELAGYDPLTHDPVVTMEYQKEAGRRSHSRPGTPMPVHPCLLIIT